MNNIINGDIPNTDILYCLASYQDLHIDTKILSKQESIRSSKFKYSFLKENYCKRISWVKHMLSEFLEIKTKDIVFKYGNFGKPMLDSCYFNYSHSQDYIFLCVCRQQPIGCDIELIDPTIEAETLSSQFFSTSEADQLLSYSKEQRHEIFYNLWSRKEAFIKANGKGLSYGLNNFSIEEKNSLDPKVYFCSEEDANQWNIYAPELVDGYKTAVAWKK